MILTFSVLFSRLVKSLIFLIIAVPPFLYGSVEQQPQLLIFLAVFAFFISQLFIRSSASLFRSCVFGREIIIVKPAFLLPFIVFFVLSWISAVYSVYPYAGKAALCKMVFFAAFFCLLVNAADGKAAVFFLVRCVIFTACLLSALGIWRYFHDTGFLAGIWTYASFSTFTTVSHFSAYISMGIPLAVVSFALAKNKFPSFCSLAVLFPAFFLGFDKGGLVQLSVSLFFLWFFLRRGKSVNLNKRAVLFVLVAALLVAVVAAHKFSFNFTADFAHSVDPTLWKRWLHWEDTVNMIKARPLTGWGPDTFRFVYPAFKNQRLDQFVEFAHQEYLQMAAEFGIAGMCVFVWGILAIFFRAAKNLLAGYNDDLKLISAGALSSCLGLLVHNIYDFNFHIPALALLFITLLVIVVKSGYARKQKTSAESNDFQLRLALSSYPAAAVFSTMGVILVLSGLFLFRGYLSDQDSRKAELLYNDLEFSAAKDEAAKALRLNRDNFSALKIMGDVFAARSRFNPDGAMTNFYEAKRFYEEAIRVNKADADAHLRLGKLYAAHKKNNSALEELKTAVSLDRASPFYWNMLGDFYLSKGVKGQARRSYEKALSLRAYDEYALKRIEQLSEDAF